MRGLGVQPGPGAGRDSRCISDREFRRSSPFDVAVAWDSHPIAGSFRITSRRHATTLQERLLMTEPERAALNSDPVAVRVTETPAHHASVTRTEVVSARRRSIHN